MNLEIKLQLENFMATGNAGLHPDVVQNLVVGSFQCNREH